MKSYLKSFEKQISERAQVLLDKSMPILLEEEFQLYEKKGDRLTYENVYFQRREFLMIYGIVLLWDRRTTYIQKLEEVIHSICEEETWALPAHVNRKDKNYRNTIDLFSAETGQALALILHHNRKILSYETQEKMMFHLEKRLIDSYLSAEEGTIRWEQFANNWISVCAGSLASIAMYVYPKSNKKQNRVLEKVVKIMPSYLRSFGNDGSCLEGLAYYNYGLSYYLGFARQIYDFSNGSIDLLHTDLMGRIASFQSICYWNNGITVSFSDSNIREKFRMGITLYMASEYEKVVLPPFESVADVGYDHCHRYWTTYQDYMWTKEYLGKVDHTEQLNVKEKFDFLEESQWAVWQDAIFGVAFKGGNNDEPHNQNDIGSFIYTVKGEVFFADVGWGEYTKAYFDPSTRYDHIATRSKGHSVPIINDREQGAGREYKADYFSVDKRNEITLSFAKAYGEESLSSLVRLVQFDKGVLEIEDCAIWKHQAQATNFEENFISYIEPKIEEHGIVLEGIYGMCKMEISNMLNFTVEQVEYYDHSGDLTCLWTTKCKIESEGKQTSCNMKIEYYER